MKNVLVLTVYAAVFSALASRGETIDVAFDLGRSKGCPLVERKTVELRPLESGGWRYVLPAHAIPSRALAVQATVPALLSAQRGEDGFWVLPDGRYGVFNQENGVCLERPRRSILPFAGFRSPRGCWMVIVRGLRLECDFGVTATNGHYQLQVNLRTGELARPAYEDGVIDFLPMPADATYVDLAKRYRAEQLAAGVVRPLAERAKERPELAFTAESIFVRVKHGWKALNTDHEQKQKWEHQTPSNQPPIHCAISFDRFKDIMRRMKEQGIDRAEVCSVGGTAGGFDGQFPDVLPIPGEFGGEQKLREAVAYGQSLGYQMVTHFATTAMFECSKEWNPDYICHTKSGDLLKSGIVAGGRTHRLCPRVYLDRFIKRDWATFRDIGFRGTHHIDVISCIPPYACFNPKHPLNRRASADCMREIGRYSQQVFGGFGSEAGFDWMAPSLDFALYVSWYPGAKNAEATPLVDRVVPLWQIVYHGIIVSNPFYATIDAYIDRKVGKKDLSDDPFGRFSYLGSATNRILKVHEFGGRPVFYYSLYEDVKPLKRAYDDYRRLSHLQYAFMDEHRELAKNVFLTRYSNGEEIIVNYSERPFDWRGRTVGAKQFEHYTK